MQTKGKGPIRRSSQTRRVASQTCQVKVLPIGVAITRWRQCLIDSFARRMSLGSSDSTCFNWSEDKMLFSVLYLHMEIQLPSAATVGSETDRICLRNRVICI